MKFPRTWTAATAAAWLGFCCWTAPAAAQGYYINPSMYTNMYAVNAAQLAQNLQFAARMKTLREQQAMFQSASQAVSSENRTPSVPFSATDFKPAGRRDAPQRLAAQIADASMRPQIIEMSRAVLDAIEQQPNFRKNNLAYALTIFLGGSLQVVTGDVMDDRASETLARWINDEMAAAGAVAKLNAAQRTQLYDVLLLQGGLIIGIHQAGVENGDTEQVQIAKTMARDALKTFGIEL